MKLLLPALAVAATASLWMRACLRDLNPVDAILRLGERRESPDDSLGVKREIMRTVARHLARAFRDWRERRLERCAESGEAILRIDPDYPVARDLRAVARRVLEDPGVHGAFAAVVDRWTAMTDDDEEAVIPHSQTFRWRTPGRADEDDPDLIAIRRKLEIMTIDLEFKDALLEDILVHVRDYSGLPIILAAEVRGPVRPDPRVSVSVRGLPVGAALAVILAKTGASHHVRVTDERIVLPAR
jgi:hypothetical protein